MRGPPITLANTFGALEVGTMVAVCMFGIVTLQAEHYFREFREDKWLLRGLVFTVWLLELGHTIGICAEVYRATIIFAGRPLEYSHFTGLGSATLLGGIITMLVQSFFSLRAWRLLPNPYRYVGVACIIVSVVRCGFSTWCAYEAINLTSVMKYTANVSWLITMLLSMGTGLDIVIAVTMLYFFMAKRKNALTTTTRLVDRLLGYTIRTGLLTSIGAIAVLIAFQLAPNSYIWAGIYCCLAKLYSNSFLSVLNGRQELRKTMGGNGVVVDGSGSSNLERLGRRKASISVVVDIKTDRDLELQENPGTWHSPTTTSPGSSTIDKRAMAPFA